MQLGFFLCLFHFPFYYYYLLFLAMPSHHFLLPVPQPPTRPTCHGQGCWDVSRLASSSTFSLPCISPSLNNTVSGKFPLPYSFRKSCQHPCVSSRSQKLLSSPLSLLGVKTQLCSPGRDLPSGASRPSGNTRRRHQDADFRKDFQLAGSSAMPQQYKAKNPPKTLQLKS